MAFIKRLLGSGAARTLGVFLLGFSLAAILFLSTVGLPGRDTEPLPENPAAPPDGESPELTAAERQELDALVSRIQSGDHNAALGAVEELAARGWLYDGSLSGLDLNGVDLHEADLSTAYLWRTDLKGADLRGANLSGTRLAEAELADADLRDATWDLDTAFGGANMTGVNLAGADLRALDLGLAFGEAPVDLAGADLHGANLGGVNLWAVNFAAADLRDANLQGATLSDANLASAELQGTQFNLRTTLPDGSQWSDRTEMAQFTDPQHPAFWRSEDPSSPAYGGEPAG